MHVHTNAPPAFGGRLKADEYYVAINSIISVMRGVATLRSIADHLNHAGFTTPSSVPWTRTRLANYLNSSAVTINQ